MKIFIDDTAWCNLVLREMPAHSQFQEVFEELLRQENRLVTHNNCPGMRNRGNPNAGRRGVGESLYGDS